MDWIVIGGGIAGWIVVAVLAWRHVRALKTIGAHAAWIESWMEKNQELRERLKESEIQRHDTIGRYEHAIQQHRNAASVCSDDVEALAKAIDAGASVPNLSDLRRRLTIMSVARSPDNDR